MNTCMLINFETLNIVKNNKKKCILKYRYYDALLMIMVMAVRSLNNNLSRRQALSLRIDQNALRYLFLCWWNIFDLSKPNVLMTSICHQLKPKAKNKYHLNLQFIKTIPQTLKKNIRAVKTKRGVY
ncbi:hypothetical protein BpHYR1_009732 [Brachionus plicatilis]|uniref:Uncharacterized protein n=1 Tax=Brachionus plicatilis TaxID=10195 RepID=A0A3M7R3P4_BRAPC|nr:hypothetical protein BpHYR1_009732 [Brachionus plicatilis]